MTSYTDEEKLGRLWDALAWLASYEPVTVDDIEGEFQISVHSREVHPLIERKVRGGARPGKRKVRV